MIIVTIMSASVQEIQLAGNSIGDAGATALAEALKVLIMILMIIIIT